MILSWQTIAGQNYRLERSPTLNADSWETVRPSEEATGLPMSFSESTGAIAGFYRLNVTPAKPLASKVAVMGDSITAQGSTNLSNLSAVGYYVWARSFGGARWDLVKNPVANSFCFAASGKRSYEISALHLQQVIAADPDVCIIVYGTNDAAQLSSVTTFRNQLLSDWEALRNAGIHPVAATIPPIGTATGDNSLRHALVVELNGVIREEAAAHQVPLCDWTGLLEAVPGSNNGIGLNSHYQNNDDYHPLPYPASLLGRALNATLNEHFRFGGDPWENINWITPNVALEGSNGQPSTGSWQIYPPGGGSIESKTLVSSPEGNWWQIAISRGSSTGNFYLNCFGANIGGSPAGSTVESIVELEVISGSVAAPFLYTGSSLAADMLGAGGIGAQIVPADGVVVLRTPAVEVPANTSNVAPTLGFRTNEDTATIRVRRCGTRKIAP